MASKMTVNLSFQVQLYPVHCTKLKPVSHGAIFLSTCNAILLLGDVK